MKDPIDAWLLMVANLVNPMYPGEAHRALSAFAPHIRGEFGTWVLTPDTARSVAEAERFGPVPAWDVIAKTLRAFIRENRPINHGQIAAPRVEPRKQPTPEDIRHVSDLLARFDAERAIDAVTGLEKAPLRDVSLNGERLAQARASVGQRG